MIKINSIILVTIVFFAQVAHAIVGYDKTAIPVDNPVHYNTVALVKKSNTGLKVFCSGSIATNKLIFTAKHCIEAVEDFEIYVYFGEDTNRIDESLLRAVEKRQTFNKVDLELSFPSFDFGVLQLVDEIPILIDDKSNELRYRPIKVLTEPELLANAAQFIVAGFGISEISHNLVHGIKRRVKTNVRKFISGAQFVSLLLLEGEKGQGTCHGDSGGPLYVQLEGEWFLIGVASGFDVGLTPGSYKVVDPKGNELAPDCFGGESVYTYVGDYVNWVSKALGEDPLTSGVSSIDEPGIDGLSASTSKNSFSDWCEQTNHLDPAWETIRQLLYFAADAKSNFPTDEVLADCDKAEIVLNSLKEISFSKDDFFNDLSPLSSLHDLESLAFIDTKVPDLSVLSNLKLKKVKLTSIGIQNLSSVKGLLEMDHLQNLELTSNELSSLNELSSFTNLKVLKLGKNNISNVELLENFKSLEVLEIYSNSISNIDSLLGLTKLKEFLAANNKITSPKKLAKWPELTLVIMSNNKLTNLNFLTNSVKIKRKRFHGNPL